MEITDKQFAALCYIVSIPKIDKKNFPKLVEKQPLLDLGFGAFKHLSVGEMNTVAQMLKELNVEFPEVVSKNLYRYE